MFARETRTRVPGTMKGEESRVEPIKWTRTDPWTVCLLGIGSECGRRGCCKRRGGIWRNGGRAAHAHSGNLSPRTYVRRGTHMRARRIAAPLATRSGRSAAARVLNLERYDPRCRTPPRRYLPSIRPAGPLRFPPATAHPRTLTVGSR